MSAVTSTGASAENTFSITEEVFFVEKVSYDTGADRPTEST